VGHQRTEHTTAAPGRQGAAAPQAGEIGAGVQLQAPGRNRGFFGLLFPLFRFFMGSAIQRHKDDLNDALKERAEAHP
jgi:hypothetical protein